MHEYTDKADQAARVPSVSATTNQPYWAWRGNSLDGYCAELVGSRMEEADLLLLKRITVHRRDGSASRHRVKAIRQTGRAPAVTVHPKGEPVAGLPFPKKPAVT